MKIKFVSNVRGFFNHLSDLGSTEVEFELRKQTYEVSSKTHKLASKVIRSPFGDFFGIIQSLKNFDNENVVIGSFNRFVKTEKPYFIYVENPTALYHYSLNRPHTYFGNRKFNKLLSDSNLKELVFMSKAAMESSEQVWNRKISIPKQVIYPYVPQNRFAEMRLKNNIKPLKLLFVAQGSRFVSKGAPEVLEAAKILEGVAEFTVITNQKSIPEPLLDKIAQLKNLNLYEFNKSYAEMEKIYAEHDILIYPTSDDSSALTVLEAIKAGMVVIGSNLYAIPEMVENGKNGFLTNPKWSFFDQDNIPNPKVWNNRESTIHSIDADSRIVGFLVDRVLEVNKNRDRLFEMSQFSLKKANSYPFDRDTIIKQWVNLAEKINN